MKHLVGWTVSLVVATTAIARAQPVPAEPSLPPDGVAASADPEEPPAPPRAPDGAAPPPAAGAPVAPGALSVDPPLAGPAVDVRRPPPEPPPVVELPEVLTTPTAFLLPAAALYGKLAIDTGGGVTGDARIGLGDVAEFGLSTIDSIRERDSANDPTSERIQPYATASFRLGVAEHRLFAQQPAVALGFRKSFERNHGGFATRVAELTLVASKHIGERFTVHVGGAFWDASVAGDLDGNASTAEREVTLHGIGNPRQQLRPFAGIAVEPLPRSQILVDIGWAPEFCYQCVDAPGDEHADSRKIRLRPVLSWGVRYAVADWLRIESGVRVPDIGDANLLEAQIFGQLTFTSSALRRAIDRAKQ